MTLIVTMLIVAILASLLIATVTEAAKAGLLALDLFAAARSWPVWHPTSVRSITLRLLALTQGVLLSLWLGPAVVWYSGSAPVADELLWLGGVGLGLTAGETARWLEDVLPRWRGAVHARVMQVLGGQGNR